MLTSSDSTKRLVTITLFSIAMGFLETSVVIYLRQLYYQHGFALPLAPIDKDILLVEILREAATIIMLLAAGIMAGKTKASRFAYFILSFGIWDIFYYVFLKLFLNWPASIMDWDILFLIPVPWFGPVLVPCIISLTMIVLAVYIIITEARGIRISIGKREWILLALGSLTFVWSCIDNFIFYMQTVKTVSKTEKELEIAAQNFIPTHFDWTTFIFAQILLCLGIAFIVKRNKK
jgi:hypothetical protein